MSNVKSVYKKGKKTPVYLLVGHATAQAVGHQPLTAEPLLKQLATSLSLQRPVFNHRSVHVDLCWTKWHWGWFLSNPFSLSLSSHLISFINTYDMEYSN